MTDTPDLSGLRFEQLLEELERITRQMAAGDIGIEEVADLDEQAGRLHAEAAARLGRVRQRIESLSEQTEGAGALPAEDGGDEPGREAQPPGHS